MSATTNQSTNLNFLSTINFRFNVEKFPGFGDFVTNVTVPGLSLGRAEQNTPFVKIPKPGDHLIYDDLVVSFKMQENLENWMMMWRWMEALGFPENFDQYASIAGSEYSDCSIVVYNSNKNPLHTFTFKDCFPVSLSPFLLATTDTDVDYPEQVINFAYRNYTVRTVTS